jgi:hypothetical protein
MGVPPPHSRYSRGWSAICDKNCAYQCNFLQIDSSGPGGENQVQALCGASFAGAFCAASPAVVFAPEPWTFFVFQQCRVVRQRAVSAPKSGLQGIA